jgi:hypothetical protein
MANQAKASVLIGGQDRTGVIDVYFWSVESPDPSLDGWGGRFKIPLGRGGVTGPVTELRLANGETCTIDVHTIRGSVAEFVGVGKPPSFLR